MLGRLTRLFLALCLVAYVNLCACQHVHAHPDEEVPACGHCHGHDADSLPDHSHECTYLHGGDVAPGEAGNFPDHVKQLWLSIPPGVPGPSAGTVWGAIRPFWNADPPRFLPGPSLHVVHQVFLI